MRLVARDYWAQIEPYVDSVPRTMAEIMERSSHGQGAVGFALKYGICHDLIRLSFRPGVRKDRPVTLYARSGAATTE